MVQATELINNNGIVIETQLDPAEDYASEVKGEELPDFGEGSTSEKKLRVKLSQRIKEDPTDEGRIFLRAFYRFHKKTGLGDENFFSAMEGYLNSVKNGGESFPESVSKFFKQTELEVNDFDGRVSLYKAGFESGSLPISTKTQKAPAEPESFSPEVLIGALEKMQTSIDESLRQRLRTLANMLE